MVHFNTNQSLHLAGDILAKDFDCNFREVAAADQVNEVSNKSDARSRHPNLSAPDRGCFP